MYFSTADAHDINTVCYKNRRPRWKRGLRFYQENVDSMTAEKSTAGVKNLKWEEDGKVSLCYRKCNFPLSAVTSEFSQVTFAPNMITAP